MWIASVHGFFSVACARQGNGAKGNPPDPNRLMVRARVKSHLNALKERFPKELGGCKMHESPFADYRYRIFVSKEVWKEVAAKLVEEIDYDNFKDAVALKQGNEDASYAFALHKTWAVMQRLQHRESRPGKAAADRDH